MKFVMSLVLALIASHTALAEDAKPSADSVKQLFAVMHTSGLIDNLMDQVEATVRGGMSQAVAGQQPNAQQQKILQDMQKKIYALVEEQLDWKQIEPVLVEVYRSHFTQHEVDGMLQFYRSDVGQAAITKLPTVTQESMQQVQGRLRTVTPKIAQLEKDTAAQIKAAGEQPAAAPAAPPPK
jgi:uncharacterized protein